jgi:hypothetical protein
VNGRDRKVLQFRQNAGEGQPKVVVMPSPEAVRRVAQEAARHDVGEVARVLSEKISMIFAEEVKSAVLLNALIEILIQKGVFTKDEYKELVKKREEETQDRYVRAKEAIRRGEDPGPIVLGKEGEGG